MPREKPSTNEEATNESVPRERPKCCHCKTLVNDSGYCAMCRCWPINVTPVRLDEYGHRVNPDGWCVTCTQFRLTGMEPQPGEWIDTGIVPKLCTKEENMRQARKLMGILSGPGWPEKIVPLRRDMIPRSWKRGELKVVGQTPLGYDIALPAGIVENVDTDTVPF